MGHNKAGHNAAQADLVKHIEKIEKLIEDRQEINDEIKDAYALAKVDGFDRRTMVEVIRLRKLSAEQRQERKSLLDTYLAAFGMDGE